MWSFLSRIFCPNETKSHCKIEQWKTWSAPSWPWVPGLWIVFSSLSTGGGSITSEFLMKLFDFSIFGICCCSIFSCPTCKWWFRMCLPRHLLSENVFSHWLQLTLDLLCAFKWAVKKLFRRNDFWHILQECGLSLEWILLCSLDQIYSIQLSINYIVPIPSHATINHSLIIKTEILINICDCEKYHKILNCG